MVDKTVMQHWCIFFTLEFIKIEFLMAFQSDIW